MGSFVYLRIFMHNEFDGLGAMTSSSFASGQEVLDFYDMGDVDVATDLIILCGFTLIFQVGFICSLYFLHTGKR